MYVFISGNFFKKEYKVIKKENVKNFSYEKKSVLVHSTPEVGLFKKIHHIFYVQSFPS